MLLNQDKVCHLFFHTIKKFFFKKKKKKKQHNVNVRHETSAGILELHYKNAIEMYRPVNKLALVNISWIKNWTFCQETSTALDDDKDPIPPHP